MSRHTRPIARSIRVRECENPNHKVSRNVLRLNVIEGRRARITSGGPSIAVLVGDSRVGLRRDEEFAVRLVESLTNDANKSIGLSSRS